MQQLLYPYDLWMIGNNHADWTEVVKRFAGGNLSYDTDKLPGLVGIASVFSKSEGERYCAELWVDSLPKDLLFDWMRAKRPSEYLAPPWSWIALNGQVEWSEGNISEDIHLLETAQVIDCDIRVTAEHPYERVKKGSPGTLKPSLVAERHLQPDSRLHIWRI